VRAAAAGERLPQGKMLTTPGQDYFTVQQMNIYGELSSPFKGA